MGGRSYAILLVLALLVGLAPTTSAQKDVDVFNWGVPYFVGTGMQGSAHFSLGPNPNATAKRTSAERLIVVDDRCCKAIAKYGIQLGWQARVRYMAVLLVPADRKSDGS